MDFVAADLFKYCANGIADVVVSNPPYVAFPIATSLQREVRDWEPSLALYRRSLRIVRVRAHDSGSVARSQTRRHPRARNRRGQSEAVSALRVDWCNLQLFPDLAGIPRVLICEKP